MSFYSLFAKYLKSERIRLGFNQSDVAKICCISREMWGKYERGIAVPGGEVLAAFASVGADIQLILTGKSSKDPCLSKDEIELIEIYRNAPLVLKTAALAALHAGSATAIPATNNSQVFSGHISGQFAGNKIINKGDVINNKKIKK